MSANAQKQLDTLLRQNNFRLVRQTKHRVWRNPDGKIFVTAATPSDWRAVKNQVTDLKRVIASDPVPEVVAVSEFERREALAKLARQEKKTGGAAAGPAKNKGCGFSYIDEKKAVTSTLTPEWKQAEREQRTWESLVRKTRQEFVASVAAKHKALAPKFKENMVRRFREYADTRLKGELRAYRNMKAISEPLARINRILGNHESRVRDMLGRDFGDRVTQCNLCRKTEEYINFCVEHGCERCRVVALNIDKFVTFATTEEVARTTEKLFNEIMQGKTIVIDWRELTPRTILWRYSVCKANELAKQLLASRPMKSAA